MKKALWIFVLSVLFSVTAVGQEGQPLTRTSVPDTSRFEIIQPNYDRATTFRLDKFTGQIHRLATCPKDDSIGSERCWKEMTIIDLPKISPGAATQVRFQIIVNNQLRLITLFNIATGQSWQYGIEPLDRWYPFIECDGRTMVCQWKPHD